MIELCNIYKKYNEKDIFADFSYKFSNHGLSIINGPNGSGKTTLLKIMSNIIKPDSGTIINLNKKLKNSEIGFVFQKPLMLKRTVWDNLIYILSTRVKISKKYNDECIKLLGYLYNDNTSSIKRLLNTDILKLSGGEQQLISLIRLLITKPKMLFLDEPFSHLDNDHSQRLAKYIEEYSKKSKVFMVTHRLELTKSLTNDILLLK